MTILKRKSTRRARQRAKPLKHAKIVTLDAPQRTRKRKRGRARGAIYARNGARSLVDRRQSFTNAQKETRKRRYVRRAISGKALITYSRIKAGKDAYTNVKDPLTGLAALSETFSDGTKNPDWVRPERPARCGWSLGYSVQIHAENGRAHYSGTERCSSIWACPVCSAVIRNERAHEISHAIDSWQEKGGSALLVTLTARHKREDSLEVTLGGVMKSWQKLLQGKAWLDTKAHYGISGYIRSVEITAGQNGWHPHIHAIFLLDRDLDLDEIEMLGDTIHSRWARYLEKLTGRTPTRDRGVDIQKVDGNGQVIGQYLSKLQDEGKRWDVGAELACSHVKHGRKDSLVPFELLDLIEKGESWARKMWVEYYEATRGRRCITWSKGLKAELLLEEKTDEEIIEETENAPIRYVSKAKDYENLRRSQPHMLAIILELAEAENWEKIGELLPGRRWDERPPDD